MYIVVSEVLSVNALVQSSNRHVLVKPIAEHASPAADPAHLDALGAPPFFAVEDGEGGPADLAFGCLADGACNTLVYPMPSYPRDWPNTDL